VPRTSNARDVHAVAAPGFLAPGGKCYICRPLGWNRRAEGAILAPPPSGAQGQLPPPPLTLPSRRHCVHGTRVIRPFDACTQQLNTWIGYIRKCSHSVRGTSVPRTPGPLRDTEIKMCLISALSVCHPSVSWTQQTRISGNSVSSI
jgi:hypothetical protein